MPKKPLQAILIDNRVILQSSDDSRELYNQSRFGEPLTDGTYHLSMLESLYLIEKKKLVVLDGRTREIPFEKFISKARRSNPDFWVKYAVYKDLRERGYIVKTALKFGADFRVYDRGIKPGDDHARWVVYPVHESRVFTWHEFAAKNRVAHSTKKRLLLGIVDDESSVTYYEVRWFRP